MTLSLLAAENRTRFIKEDPHVHCVHVQLDGRAMSSIPNVWVTIMQHNDVVSLHNLLHVFERLRRKPSFVLKNVAFLTSSMYRFRSPF